MRILPHPSATRRFAPPADWSADAHGECGTLEIAEVAGEGGLPYMESLWQPEAEDLAKLNAGAAIALGVQGQVHPVVYLGVTEPPQHDVGDPRRPIDSTVAEALAAAVMALRSYQYDNSATDLAKDVADAGVAALDRAGFVLEGLALRRKG
jgi:hypothetical protein